MYKKPVRIKCLVEAQFGTTLECSTASLFRGKIEVIKIIHFTFLLLYLRLFPDT